MKNCIVKIIDNVFEKNDEGGLFPINPRFLQIRLRHESRDKYVIHISKTVFQKMLF